MKFAVIGLAAALILAAQASAKQHLCAEEARKQAAKLLALHMDDTEMKGSIDDKVTVKPSVKALRGKGKFDVLETTGYVYKAQYRIRMIYAVMSKDLGPEPEQRCTLMGQEILEFADPF
jgi:hypothetical protein